MSHCEETEEEVVDPPETSLCEQHGCQNEAQRVPLKRKASTGSNCLSYRSQDHINAEVESGSGNGSSSDDEGVVPDNVDQLQSEKNSSSIHRDIDFRRDQSKEDINVKEEYSPVRKKRKKTQPDSPGFSFPMESYRSTFSHGLSANVLSPLSWLQEHHEWMLEPQDLSPCVSSSSSSSSSSSEEDIAADDGDRDTTSDSKESTTSSVSFKSDRSKDKIINFKDGPSALRKKDETSLSTTPVV